MDKKGYTIKAEWEKVSVSAYIDIENKEKAKEAMCDLAYDLNEVLKSYYIANNFKIDVCNDIKFNNSNGMKVSVLE